MQNLIAIKENMRALLWWCHLSIHGEALSVESSSIWKFLLLNEYSTFTFTFNSLRLNHVRMKDRENRKFVGNSLNYGE